MDDTLRPDVFPLVDCFPDDSEVEVVHVRGVKKCRRRGRTRDTANSESSDMTTERRSSPESGYRSIPDHVPSTPIASTDVSNDSLASVCSCQSSIVTSPHPSGQCSSFTGEGSMGGIRTETPSIVTRTAAEDELIRSILEEHCKSFCPPVISDAVSSTPLPVNGRSNCVSVNHDIPSPTVDVYGTSLSADRSSSVEEKIDAKLDETRLLAEESVAAQVPVVEVSEVFAVNETGSVAALVVEDDEISIYDDGRLAVQRASVQEAAPESVAGLGNVTEDRHLSCTEPVCQLFADTDSIVSDTKMSRTSSVSSSLSLESFTNAAEVR